MLFIKVYVNLLDLCDIQYYTLALGGVGGFFGMAETILPSFPFLIRDMKTSKRNCRDKEKYKYNHSLNSILTV